MEENFEDMRILLSNSDNKSEQISLFFKISCIEDNFNAIKFLMEENYLRFYRYELAYDYLIDSCKNGGKVFMYLSLETDFRTFYSWEQFIEISIKSGNRKIVNLYLEKIREKYPNAVTICLEYAAIYGDFDFVKKLFENNYEDINFSQMNKSCLTSVCYNEHLKIVKYFFEKFPENSGIFIDLDLALRKICYYGNIDIVKYILDESKKVINLSKYKNFYAIFECGCSYVGIVSQYCKKHGKYSICQNNFIQKSEIIEKRTKLNKYLFDRFYGLISDKLKNKALYIICKNKNTKLLSLILEKYHTDLYLNPNKLCEFNLKVLKCVESQLGSRTFMVLTESSWCINLSFYDTYFKKKEKIYLEDTFKFYESDNILIYSKNNFFECVVKEYQQKIKLLNVKSARK